MPTDTRKAARAMDTGTQNVSAPTTTAPQGSSQAPAIDPQVLTMISDKRDRLASAYDQVAASLRSAAAACDEFARVLPKDVSIIPSPMQFMPPVSGGAQLQTHIYQPQMGQQGILSPSRKVRKAATRDPNAPKKPNTAYIIFSNEIRAEMKAQNPAANQKELVTLIGQRWKRLTAEEKKVYEARYGADKERYDEELRIYKQAHGNINSPPPSSSDENTEHSMLANAQNMQFMTMVGSSVLASASMMPYQGDALLSLPASHATMPSFAPVAPTAPPPLPAESGDAAKRKADETQDNAGQSGGLQQYEGESNAKKRKVQARGKKNEGETHSGSLTSETAPASDESPKRQRRTRSAATTPANGSGLGPTRKRRAKDEATAA